MSLENRVGDLELAIHDTINTLVIVEVMEPEQDDRKWIGVLIDRLQATLNGENQ